MKKMLDNIASIARNTQSSNIRMIDIDELHPSPDNFFEVIDIPEFASTILGQGGVKDNLLVTPMESGGYEIISGHRRAAAVRYLLEQGKAISRLIPCLVQNYDSEADKIIDLILCNVATRQISDKEMWRSYEELEKRLKELKSKKEVGEKFGSIRHLIAERLQVSAAQVGKMQNVTHNAIEPVKEAVANGDLSISTADEIAKLPKKQQKELAAGDLKKVTRKEVKKKKEKAASAKTKSEPASKKAEKVATYSNFSEGQDTSADKADSNLSIKLDTREATLLSMTLTGYLADCDESDSVKDELREIIKKLDAVIPF